MVYYKPTSAILSAVTFSKPEKFERPSVSSGDINWVTALESAHLAFPDATIRLIIWPRAENSPAAIRMKQPSEWHPNGRTYAYINPKTSFVVVAKNANTFSRGERIGNAIYPLHSAAIGGRIYEVIGFLTGLVLSLLGLIGAWTYLQVLRRKRTRLATPV